MLLNIIARVCKIKIFSSSDTQSLSKQSNKYSYWLYMYIYCTSTFGKRESASVGFVERYLCHTLPMWRFHLFRTDFGYSDKASPISSRVFVCNIINYMKFITVFFLFLNTLIPTSMYRYQPLSSCPLNGTVYKTTLLIRLHKKAKRSTCYLLPPTLPGGVLNL